MLTRVCRCLIVLLLSSLPAWSAGWIRVVNETRYTLVVLCDDEEVASVMPGQDTTFEVQVGHHHLRAKNRENRIFGPFPVEVQHQRPCVWKVSVTNKPRHDWDQQP